MQSLEQRPARNGRMFRLCNFSFIVLFCSLTLVMSPKPKLLASFVEKLAEQIEHERATSRECTATITSQKRENGKFNREKNGSTVTMRLKHLNMFLGQEKRRCNLTKSHWAKASWQYTRTCGPAWQRFESWTLKARSLLTPAPMSVIIMRHFWHYVTIPAATSQPAAASFPQLSKHTRNQTNLNSRKIY